LYKPQRRSMSMIVVLTMSFMLLLPVGAVAKGTPSLPNYEPVPAPESVRTEILPASALHRESGSTTTANAGSTPEYDAVTGEPVLGILYDDTAGYFLDDYTVVGVGQHIEVWVQDDMSFPAGDPRATPVITPAQVDYLVDQFDNNIYPKESAFWRTPETRAGHDTALGPDVWAPTDGQDRVIAMISNVRDDNYYDPTFPVYIAGFFSPTVSSLMDRNVISIDAYDWGNRVGPQGSPWRPADGTANDRPYLYEGTFAHEYQHLLHADQNPGEENWVNEGLSDWTEWLVGYGIPGGHWDTAQQYAENSLVVWGDQGDGTELLADYGEAFMFMHYLYSQYGEAGMQALFQNSGFGIAGFNAALASIGANDNFADMYHDFAIARLVLANKGDYSLPDIPSPVVLNEEAYNSPEGAAQPWGSDYISIPNPKKLESISFDGVDVVTKDTAWTSVDDPLGENGQVLWSGEGDEVDNWAIFETTGGGTLSFDTLYDIELAWDYGFVQVSADGGSTWDTLTNADTTDVLDPDGYPAIHDILDAGGEGFGGYSGGWVNEEFSLSAYSGPILVAFRFMSDWGFNGNNGDVDPPNWYVDNVEVDDTIVSDGSNASSFHDLSYYNPTPSDFTVDLVSLPKIGSIHNSAAKVLHLITDDETEMASADQIRQALRNSKVLVLVITYDAPQGVSDTASYDLSFTYR
jgi:immune inhibitor A